jgi:uncharacterized protein (TIGR02231 family)
MRFCILPALLFSGSLATAETFPVSSQISEVTIHPSSGVITRVAEVDLPAGDHQLLLQRIPQSALLETLRLDLTGATLLGTVHRSEDTPHTNLERPDVRDARLRVEEIEARIQTVKDEAEQARAAGRGADVAIRFLSQLGQNEALPNSGPDALRDISRMISEEATRANQSLLQAEVAARAIEQKLKDLDRELARAQQNLKALDLESEDRALVALNVRVATETRVALRLSYLVEYAATWAPAYDLHLRTGDAPELLFTRNVLITQDTGENWENVTLSLSTLDPVGRTDPYMLYPDRLRISDPQKRKLASPSAIQSRELLAEPVVEAPVIMEADAGTVGFATSLGNGVTYVYSQPVSVATGAEVLQVELDSVTLPADHFADAAPLRNAAAFHVARVTNTSGEELLPADRALRYIDGDLVGVGTFPGLLPGDEIEVGFGEVDDLQLERHVLDRNEGDRGLITRTNEKAEKVVIKLRNLSDRTWPVRLRDRVPYSEQEDLEIEWNASPAPAEQDHDNARGILAWELSLPGKSSRDISLTTRITWPEGMILE